MNEENLPLFSIDGRTVTVMGRTVTLMNEHEAKYLFDGIMDLWVQS